MTSLSKLSLLACAAFVASTTLTLAGPGGPMNQPVLQMPQQPILNLNANGNGNGNNKPGIIDLDPPSFDPGPKPKIPIIGPFPHHTTVSDDKGMPDVGCKVKGPGTTDDMWIVNTGEVVLPMGSRIRYRVPATGDHGTFELPRDLAVGQKLKIADLLDNAPSGAPCSVRIVV